MLHFRFKQVFDGTVHFVAFLVGSFGTTNDVRYNRYVSCDLNILSVTHALPQEGDDMRVHL